MDSTYEFHVISGAIFGSLAIFNGIVLLRTFKKLKAGQTGLRTKMEFAAGSIAQVVAVGFLVAIAYLAWFQRTNDLGYERIMRGGSPDASRTNVLPMEPLSPE